MKISARNVLKGRVVKIEPGAVDTEITLELQNGMHMVSVITRASVERLGLKPGVDAYAVIKASDVMVAVD